MASRFVWLIACVWVIAFSLGCGGGSEPATETETGTSEAPPPVPPGDAAEDAGREESAEDLLEEEMADIAPGGGPVVEMSTNFGTIAIELYPDKAPKTVENFISYVRSGFYDQTIFHRVVPGFVIQGGGFTTEMEKKETEAPIENEADNGLLNLRGTICMARTNEPHSATSQFFINTKDNPALDYRERTLRGWGYAVFGKVIEGLEIVDQIEGVQTTTFGSYRDVPAKPVIIESARIIS